MSLAHGGHLTHGHSVNFSGRGYTFYHYGVREDTGRIDYDEVRAKARRHKPKLIVAGASAYPRQLDFAAFRQIADEVGAELMVDMAHIAGLVAAGVHPSPFGFADWVSTTTHKTLAGPRGGACFCGRANASRLDKAVFPGLQGGPLEHVIAGKAVCFHAGRFRGVQGQATAHGGERGGARQDADGGRAQAGLRRHGQPSAAGGLPRHAR